MGSGCSKSKIMEAPDRTRSCTPPRITESSYQEALEQECAHRPTTPPANVAANARVIAASVGNVVAKRHAKLCLDPSTLASKGVFGDMKLLDCALEDQLGCMGSELLRDMLGEHCISSDSQTEFSPPNNPDLMCTPEREFWFVVGAGVVDTTTWKLKKGALPTCGVGSMVAGRNAKTVAELLERPEAKRSGLRESELIALRLYSGPMWAVYNPILRPALAFLETAGSTITKNLYPTTIQLIVSGICKLCRVADAPAGMCVFRGLSGVALPKEFFEPDHQGFAGGVEASFMSTTLDEQVSSLGRKTDSHAHTHSLSHIHTRTHTHTRFPPYTVQEYEAHMGDLKCFPFIFCHSKPK